MLFSFEPKNERNISALKILHLGQKYFVRFLVQMKTTKSPFEIDWPLTFLKFHKDLLRWSKLLSKVLPEWIWLFPSMSKDVLASNRFPWSNPQNAKKISNDAHFLVWYYPHIFRFLWDSSKLYRVQCFWLQNDILWVHTIFFVSVYKRSYLH